MVEGWGVGWGGRTGYGEGEVGAGREAQDGRAACGAGGGSVDGEGGVGEDCEQESLEVVQAGGEGVGGRFGVVEGDD